jgi:hypothetical protein
MDQIYYSGVMYEIYYIGVRMKYTIVALCMKYTILKSVALCIKYTRALKCKIFFFGVRRLQVWRGLHLQSPARKV